MAQSPIICDTSANIVIFSNYDGGYLNINVDKNIPNLKIGIVSYENAKITISGTYASNVTKVWYAGYNSTNNHCGITSGTTINGVPNSVDSILFYPPATLNDPNGDPNIICAYDCDTVNNQGGCNTIKQVNHFFQTHFSGTIYSHHTQYGCWSNATTYNVSQGGNCCINNLTIPQAPLPDFSASDSTICVGQCINYTDLSLNSPTAWTWTFQGANTPNAFVSNPTNICYNTPGTYSVGLTVGNSVGNNSIVKANFITVVAYPSTPTITNNSNVLSSSSPSGNQWYLNGSPIPGATMQTYTVTQNGNYTVEVTINGCSSISSPIAINNVGIAENSAHVLNIYPNPASEEFYIQTPLRENKSVTIYDVNGKTVYTNEVFEKEIKVSVKNWEKGLYFIHIHSSSAHYVGKLIKNNDN